MQRAFVDSELLELESRAQAAADREGKATAVLNLNRAGRRLLVIRGADVLAPGELPYSGPFQPQGAAQ